MRLFYVRKVRLCPGNAERVRRLRRLLLLVLRVKPVRGGARVAIRPGRERPGPFCKRASRKGYSEDDVSFQLRQSVREARDPTRPYKSKPQLIVVRAHNMPRPI